MYVLRKSSCVVSENYITTPEASSVHASKSMNRYVNTYKNDIKSCFLQKLFYTYVGTSFFLMPLLYIYFLLLNSNP